MVCHVPKKEARSFSLTLKKKKISSKQTKHLTLKLLEEINIGKTLKGTGISKNFPRRTPTAQGKGARCDTQDRTNMEVSAQPRKYQPSKKSLQRGSFTAAHLTGSEGLDSLTNFKN